MNSGIVHKLKSFSMTSRKLCDKNDTQCIIIYEMAACAWAYMHVSVLCMPVVTQLKCTLSLPLSNPADFNDVFAQNGT